MSKTITKPAKTSYIQAKIQPELKEQVEAIFEKLGLSSSQAISMFYNQVLLQNGIPFEVKIPQANITLADIFNESEQSSQNISEEEMAKWWNANKGKIKR
jgi:DNA-damage-inducible protein J